MTIANIMNFFIFIPFLFDHNLFLDCLQTLAGDGDDHLAGLVGTENGLRLSVVGGVAASMETFFGTRVGTAEAEEFSSLGLHGQLTVGIGGDGAVSAA